MDISDPTSLDFEGFFNIALDLLCIADTEGKFVRVSKAWEGILGYSNEYLENHRFLDFVHPDDLEATLEAMNQLSEQRQVLNFVNRYKCKNGEWKYIEWRSHPVGKLIYAAARDITDRIQAEMLLKEKNDEYLQLTEELTQMNHELLVSKRMIEEREQNYREIFNSTNDAIFIHDSSTGKVIDVNDTMLKMYGFSSKDEVINRDVSQLSAEDEGYNNEKANLLISKALENKINTFEWLAQKKTGEKFWIEVSLRHAKIGGEQRLIGTARDISERKKAEESIKSSHITYKGIIDSVSEAIYIQNEQGNFLFVNKAAEDLYGYPRDFFVGKTPEFLSAPNKNNFDEVIKTVGNAFNGIPGQFEFWGIKKDGTVFPKEVSVSPGSFFGQKAVIAVARDISERKNVEIQLQEKTKQIEAQNEEYKQLNYELSLAKDSVEQKEKKFRSLVESAFDGIYLLHGRQFSYVNPQFIEITGYSYEELTSSEFDFNSLLTEKSRKLVKERYEARQNGQSIPARYEIKIITKQNEIKSVELSTVSIGQKNQVLVMGIMKDVTQRRNMQRELLQRSRLQNLLVNLGAKFINIPDQNIESGINAALEEIGQFTQVDRVYIFSYNFGKGIMSNTHEWCAEGIEPEIDNLQELPNSLVPQWINAHVNGDIIHIPRVGDLPSNDTVRQILDQQGVKSATTIPMVHEQSCLGFVGFDSVKEHKEWNDSEITLLKLFAELLINVQVKASYEQSLKEAMQVAEIKQMEVRNIIDYSPVGIVLIASDGKIIDVNQSAVKMLGSPSAVETQKLNVLKVKPLKDIGFADDFYKCINTKSIIYNESKYVSIWGKEIFVKYYLVPMVFDGVVESILANIEDISEIKEAEQKLIALKEKAEESDRLKSAFLANMSHEIRTPMNAICGLSNLLLNKSVDDKQKEGFVEVININSQQLLSIINDIIDVSKIESGQITVSRIKFSINDILSEIESIFSVSAKEKGIGLKHQVGLPYHASHIVSDEIKIKQILNNLVANALRYTAKGLVEFGYTLQGDFIEFFVKDTGIGVKPEDFKRIFERFRQIENTTTESRKGTGLGLSISKAFVELLGGQIWLTSEVGVGTTFFFTIPYEPVVIEIIQTEPIEQPQYIWEGKNIMIAEDDPPNYMFLRELIAETKASVVRAKDGREALEIFLNSHIDLILMDLKMPAVDGFQATREIRKMGYSVPIIAQTAYAFSEDKVKAIECGCNDYISKPIRKEEMLRLIQKLFDEQHRSK